MICSRCREFLGLSAAGCWCERRSRRRGAILGAILVLVGCWGLMWLALTSGCDATAIGPPSSSGRTSATVGTDAGATDGTVACGWILGEPSPRQCEGQP